MKRFKIESIAIVDREPDCYRVTIYASPTGGALDRCVPTVEGQASGLTAVEALVIAIIRLGLASQVTDELSRKAARKQEASEPRCRNCGAIGNRIHNLGVSDNGKHMLYYCRACGCNWTEKRP